MHPRPGRTPPKQWYVDDEFAAMDAHYVFKQNWVAVDVLRCTDPGQFQTGHFTGQPYLVSCNKGGEVKAYYNVCTHAGSCLAGHWTEVRRVARALCIARARKGTMSAKGRWARGAGSGGERVLRLFCVTCCA